MGQGRPRGARPAGRGGPGSSLAPSLSALSLGTRHLSGLRLPGACLVLQLKQLYQMLFLKNPAPSWHIQGAQPVLSAAFMVTRTTRRSCS